MAKDYLPKSDAELLLWLGNFQTKLATHGATVGLTPVEITALSTLCTNITTGINTSESKKNEAKNAVAAKETLKTDNVPGMRNDIKRMKTHSGYTQAIGADMGIIGSDEVAPDKPTIKGRVTPNDVVITFTKKGFDGVNVYARLKGTSGWTFLARDTNSPYNDARPLAAPGTPETREYMCIGVISDDEVGEESDIVSVIFGG